MKSSNSNVQVDFRSIILFTIPSIAALAIEPLAGLIDSALIGHQSTEWLSGLAICTTVFTSFTWIFNFLVHSVTARIGRSFGAGDLSAMKSDYTTAVLLSLSSGLVVGLALVLLRPFIFEWVMSAPEPASQAAKGYFYARALALPFAITLNTLVAMLRGIQKIRSTLIVMMVTTLINAIGSFFSLFVLDAGFTGVGVATAVSFIIGCLIAFGMLRYSQPMLKIERSSMRKKDLFSFGADAWHMGGRTAMLLGSFFLATMLASRLGSAQVAAHQILYQYWIMASFVVDGLAITASAMGSPLLGSSNNRDFVVLGRRLMIIGLILGIIISILYLGLHKYLPLLFTNDTEVINLVSSLWLMIGLAQSLNALVFVSDGIIFSLRDFRYLRNNMAVGVICGFIPCALIGYWCYESLAGIWVGLVVLYLVRLVTNMNRFNQFAIESGATR